MKYISLIFLYAAAIWTGAVCTAPAAYAQDSLAGDRDPLQNLNESLRRATHEVFSFTFEERTRWEEKYGVSFGKAVNQQDMLSRLRVGAVFHPLNWLTISAMGQDARAPFYGAPAPGSLRDTWDLQEAYFEIFGERKTGFGATAGREMLNYGETRVIGTPQWSNTSRTYDHMRLYYRTEKDRLEFLVISPVKVLPDEFNVPEPGERIWGMYDTFANSWRGATFDLYGLRHTQNKPGGWTGPGTLATDSFGARMAGPLARGFAYSLEGIEQTGHAGLVNEHAYAWFTGGSHRGSLAGRALFLSAEIKEASGTRKGETDSSTYDQISPANHDKFGQQDLFGWRNLRTLKSLDTYNVTKPLAVNLMYTNHWLASSVDSLYNSSGSAIATSKTGIAGTHVGQELDTFLTYSRGAHLLGAGIGYFFKGEFIEDTTPHINSRYFYVFQQYSFK